MKGTIIYNIMFTKQIIYNIKMVYEMRGGTKSSLIEFFSYQFHIFIRYVVDLSMELRYISSNINLCIYEFILLSIHIRSSADGIRPGASGMARVVYIFFIMVLGVKIDKFRHWLLQDNAPLTFFGLALSQIAR